MKFIIEHCDEKVWEWAYIEYKMCSEHIGKENIIFSNIKRKSDREKLSKLGEVHKESLADVNLPKQKTIILDPEAKKELTPSDIKYEYFVFGGILGDYPMRKRTKKMITSKMKGCKIRNLGKEQFSTDNAVFVAKEILNGNKLKNMKFIKPLIIKTGKNEELILNFSYPVVNGKVLVSKELIKYIKEDKGF
ncbi:MAG: SAM-dependent methyltransferase [Candidatus Nanoarchaeia archaeon]|nr:SAM-dependent methyltransferase [Candidatus Nanoarchaeia archaeon]